MLITTNYKFKSTSQNRTSFKASDSDLSEIYKNMQQLSLTQDEVIQVKKAPKETIAKKVSNLYKNAKKSYKAILIGTLASLSFAGGYLTRPFIINGENNKIEELKNNINSQHNKLDSINNAISTGYKQIDSQKKQISAFDSTYVAKIENLETRLADVMDKTQNSNAEDTTLNSAQEEVLTIASNIKTKAEQDTTITAYKPSGITDKKTKVNTNKKTKVNTNKKTKVKKLKRLPVDDNGYTELHRLCKDGNTDAVRNYIKNHPDFDINQRTDGLLGKIYGKKSYIELAILSKDEDLINMLADNKSIDLGNTDSYGWNDLHYLCLNGYTKAVKKIIENHPNFDINQKTKRGDSYMDLARRSKNKKLVALLAKYE